MINGQVNIASLQSLLPCTTLESSVPNVVTVDSEQNQGENFAGLLGEIQLLAQSKAVSESRAFDASQMGNGFDPLVADINEEQRNVDVMALFQQNQIQIPTSAAIVPSSTEPEKTSFPENAVLQGREISSATSQMVLAAYVQSGRMPDVNIPTPLPVDGLQNGATHSESPVVVNAGLLLEMPEQRIEKLVLQSAASLTGDHTQPPISAHVLAENVLQTATVNKSSLLVANDSQKADVLTPDVLNQKGHAAVEMKPPAARQDTLVDRRSKTAGAPVPEAFLKQVEVLSSELESDHTAHLFSGKLQNVVTAPDQLTVNPAKSQVPTLKNSRSIAEQPFAQSITESAIISTQRNKPETAQSKVVDSPSVTAATLRAGATHTSTVTQSQPDTSMREHVSTVSGKPAEVIIQTGTNPFVQFSELTGSAVRPAKSIVILTEEPDVKQAVVQTRSVETEDAQSKALEGESVDAAPSLSIERPDNSFKASKMTQQTVDQLQSRVVPHATDRLEVRHLVAPAPVALPESELDIQLPAELRITDVRASNDKAVVNEINSVLPFSKAVGESMESSGTSSGGEGNQEQSTDNPLLTQNMRGYVVVEHQKVSFAPHSLVTSEQAVTPEVAKQAMQQVNERLVRHDVKAGNQQITLTLSPDSLGELKLNLNLQGQKLSVEIITENRSVRDVIIQHTDSLKESLARQNITMESFDVTTGGRGSGNQAQNQNAWRELEKQQQQQLWASPRGYQAAHSDSSPGSLTYQKQQGQSMLDIHY